MPLHISCRDKTLNRVQCFLKMMQGYVNSNEKQYKAINTALGKTIQGSF